MSNTQFAQKLAAEFPRVQYCTASRFVAMTPAGSATVIVSRLPDGRMRVISYSEGKVYEPEVVYTQLRLELDAKRIARDVVEMLAAVAHTGVA
jgi:hypothetical protein